MCQFTKYNESCVGYSTNWSDFGIFDNFHWIKFGMLSAEQKFTDFSSMNVFSASNHTEIENVTYNLCESYYNGCG